MSWICVTVWSDLGGQRMAYREGVTSER
jgi:hypothetical protein